MAAEKKSGLLLLLLLGGSIALLAASNKKKRHGTIVIGELDEGEFLTDEEYFDLYGVWPSAIQPDSITMDGREIETQ